MSHEHDNTDEQTINDEEFHDAESKTNEEIIEELISKHSKLAVDDNEECLHTDVEYKKSNVEIFSDCHDDLIDEEHLRELEKDLSEEQKKENKEKADQLKLEGNELFRKEIYTESVETYTKALKVCPLEYTKERAVFYANRAAAKIKLDSKNAAIEDCTRALELNSEYVRALLRRAKLFEDTDKLDEALEDYKKVVELDEDNKDGRDALIRLPPLILERNEKLKTEMLGKLKDLGNMILKPFGLSTNNFQMRQDESGAYSFNFNQNAK